LAKKKRRRTGKAGRAGTGPPAPLARERASGSSDRRNRGESRGRQRSPRESRPETRRRTFSPLLVIAAVSIVGYVLFFPAASPQVVPLAARNAAGAAGCTAVTSPIPQAQARGGLHLQPGESYTYSRHPATSGYHDPSPLPPEPKIHAEPLVETRAVHNLEHAYVIVYYRVGGSDALPQDVVDSLASYVRSQSRMLMAPYPDLPKGAALALAAWNKLQTCPASVSAEDARTITSGFVTAFRGTSNAPEPPRGLVGRWLQP
jgi:hypothetical protein